MIEDKFTRESHSTNFHLKTADVLTMIKNASQINSITAPYKYFQKGY